MMSGSTKRPRVIIVGGGFAGLNLAKELRNSPVEILMFDRHNYHTFQPLLYQVATGALDAGTVAFPIRRIFQRQKNFSFLIAEVLKVNAADNTLQTTLGNYAYDYLVLATGAATNFFGNEQLQHFTMDMKTVPQALNLRSMMLQNLEKALTESDPVKKKSLMTFVVIGGGPTGVELAGSLAEMKNHILGKDYPSLDKNQMEIYVVESKPRLLGVMSEESSAAAKKYLEEMGVTIYNGVRLNSYDGETLQINDGKVLHAKNVLWAAGVIADIPDGIEKEKLAGGNRIITDEFNQVKGWQNVFAIGDVSAIITADLPNGHPGVAQVAIQQGKHLAKNIEALVDGKAMAPFHYNDKGSLATIGRNQAVADLGKFKTQGFLAWLIWTFVHLFSLIGFKNRISVFLNWVDRYFSYNASSRLIIRPFNSDIMTEDVAAK